MIDWKIYHKDETVSTNVDARVGRHGDVFTADYQTSGRGRLNHRWVSERGQNLIMSAVLGVYGIPAHEIATLPLVVGLAVLKAIRGILSNEAVKLKWPNDVLVSDRKICGILCERHEDCVIAGIGMNVWQREFPPELMGRVTSLALEGRDDVGCKQAMETVLSSLSLIYEEWKTSGFGVVHREIEKVDFLRGRVVSVIQSDDDGRPVSGVCGGIRMDGALDVDGQSVYAGEAHLEAYS